MNELRKGKNLSSFGEARWIHRLSYYMTHIKWKCLNKKKEEIPSILSMAIKFSWTDLLNNGTQAFTDLTKLH
jgi:hypothetical protein